MNGKFGDIAAQLAAIASSEVRRDEIHQALHAAYKAGIRDYVAAARTQVDEPDVSDIEFAERAEDDKDQAFSDSRGVGR